MPRAATLASVENAITGTPRARAARPTGPTVSANNGPKTISAPSSSACCAACCAPGAPPPSSFTRSWRSGLLNSAATAALPLADNGRIRPPLTFPSPILVEGCDGAPGEEPKSGRFPEQPASTTMDASAAHHGEEARAGRGPRDLSPPNMGRGLLDDDR